MPLPSTGPISFDDIRTELGSSSGPISLGDDPVMDLSGLINKVNVGINRLRGKTQNYVFDMSSYTFPQFDTLTNVRSLAKIAGWPGTGNLKIVVPTGFVSRNIRVASTISSIDPAPADHWFGDVEIEVNGSVVGFGGVGARGWGGNLSTCNFAAYFTVGTPGDAGHAVTIGGNFQGKRKCTVVNNGLIAGGGGGGGGGGMVAWGYPCDADVASGGSGSDGAGAQTLFDSGQKVPLPSTWDGTGNTTVYNNTPGGISASSTTNTAGNNGTGFTLPRWGRSSGRGGRGGSLGANGSRGILGSMDGQGTWSSTYNSYKQFGLGGAAIIISTFTPVTSKINVINNGTIIGTISA
jgi:hypothetical protein